jgi:3-oxoacyl-[acyl-carrier-protein] synthase II
MAPQTRSDVVVTGGASLRRAHAGGAGNRDLAPERWAGAPARLARLDRLSALALSACDACLRDAGVAAPFDERGGDRTALVVGTAFGSHAVNEDYYRGLIGEGPATASPRLFAATLPSSAAGEIGIHYRIRGPATTLASGRTAGLDALVEAARQLEAALIDRALAIAADAATPLLASLLGNGLTIDDAAAALLLERADFARARGARIRARVLGSARGHVAGDARAAAEEAAHAALAHAGADHAARALAAADAVPETLGAAPVIAIVEWLQSGDGAALFMAADPAGSATAIVLARP